MTTDQNYYSPVYGFTGEPTDANGLLYLRARYYSPNLGVFTRRDPFEGTLERLMSLNGYLWVEGNPTNLVDPSGLQVVETACGIMVASPFDLVVGDAICLIIAGVALVGALRAGQAASSMAASGSHALAPLSPDPKSPYTDEDIIALTDYLLSLDDARKLSELCNTGICGEITLNRLFALSHVQAKSNVRSREEEREEEPPTLYRGTGRVLERQLFKLTSSGAIGSYGWIMSDIAIDAVASALYASEGITADMLTDARTVAQSALNRYINQAGSLEQLVEEHSSQGTLFQTKYGGKRAIISLTSRVDKAREFASFEGRGTGAIFEVDFAQVRGLVYPQTLPTAEEGEWVALLMLQMMFKEGTLI